MIFFQISRRIAEIEILTSSDQYSGYACERPEESLLRAEREASIETAEEASDELFR